VANETAGSLWLRQYFKLDDYRLTHKSFIGQRDKIELSISGDVEQTYGPKYAPHVNSPLQHIEFAIKYDDFSLDFLKAVFDKITIEEVTAYVESTITGKYARKIGYLYEWLTNKEIKLSTPVSGNYVELLEEERYVTGKAIKNSRWRINDNLLGTREFCPIVRKTQAMNMVLGVDLKAQIENLKKDYSPDIFHRAIQYLYRKETKSSYEIESENPSPDRVNRFIAILNRAGTLSGAELLDETNLTALQSAIVDKRFAAPGFRDFQTYIGQSSLQYGEIFHYICPPPRYVSSLMQGLKDTEEKSTGSNAIIRSAIISFGFVFIHPFEDGNGRLHRFLIHDIFTRDGIVQPGLIIPVSAHMINHMRDYDRALEDYSKTLMQRIQYTSSANGEVKVTNAPEVESYFRYPDLTYQSVYLAQTITATISQDMTEELNFLERYDELKKDFQNLVDMPDKDINDIIMFLHQNKGTFPNRRKGDFPKLTADEFLAMENIYREIFK
jgi:Fic/DOC family